MCFAWLPHDKYQSFYLLVNIDVYTLNNHREYILIHILVNSLQHLNHLKVSILKRHQTFIAREPNDFVNNNVTLQFYVFLTLSELQKFNKIYH